MTEGLRLSELQRARLLSAMTDVACERGAGNVTASDVVAKAGVSRRTFYEQFSSCEACLLAAIDNAISQVAVHVQPVVDAAESWQEQIRAGLTGMLGFFDQQPMLARLLIVETLAAGSQARKRRGTVLDMLAGIVEQGRTASTPNESERANASRKASASKQASLPGMTAEALVGGVLSVLYEHVARSKRGRLASLAPELCALIVLPYLGAAACKHELERAPIMIARRPGNADGGHDAAHQLVKDAALRLTARTVTTLAAVAEHPGSSNRMLAEHVGMRDQGQASKLLMRLQARGLVENTASASPRGAPNSWRLTGRGRRLNELIGRQHPSDRRLNPR